MRKKKVNIEKLLKLLSNGSNDGKSLNPIANVLDKIQIKEFEQVRPIVPIEEWINDDYYVGRDARKLYPFWKDLICEIFRDGKQNYNQVVLTGGIGTGKSTCGLYIVLRKLYELSCYENVAGLFDSVFVFQSNKVSSGTLRILATKIDYR